MATLDGGGTQDLEPRELTEIPESHGDDMSQSDDSSELDDSDMQDAEETTRTREDTLGRHGEESGQDDAEHLRTEASRREGEEEDDHHQPPTSPPDVMNAAPGTRWNPIILDSSPMPATREPPRRSNPMPVRAAEGGGSSSSSALRVEHDSEHPPHSSRPIATRPPPILGPSSVASDNASIKNPSSRSGEIVLPRWQPDSEVTYCPICNTQFSIFVRKHHCRKCGRVVCSSCSPHRITIPYQYIVQPPGYSNMPSHRYPPLPGNEGYADFHSLGGGERVRLCNPCVPDPNTAPPQAHDPGPRVHQRSASSLLSPTGQTNMPRVQNPYPTQPPDPYARSRSVTMQSMLAAPQASRGIQYLGPPVFGGTPPAYFPAGSSSHQRHQHGPVPSRSYEAYGRAGPSGAASTSVMDRSLPPLPAAQQAQIAEEDECPICHRELPRRSLPNFETLREAHINICITAHSAYGSPSTGAVGSTDEDDGAPLPRLPPRTTRMFPYVATEKDCVDSAECSICLEEFEAGVSMARLECLCRFHRHCIRAWWERHPGRCPMHQHDSYGY